MESNRKRKGLIKGKLVMSFYRAAKPSSTSQYSSKVKPSPSSASTGYQEYSVPPQKQKVVSFVKPEGGRSWNGLYSGGDATGDENVDVKAETYISYVQERFRHEQVDSDWRRPQEIHL